jgi:hypothetical protein
MLSYPTIYTTIAKRISLVVALGALLSAGFAHALRPIENITDAPISGNPSLSAVAGAIKLAGEKRKWAMKSIAPGHIQAMQNSRGLMARVDIKFSRTSYSITYHSSDGLKYKEGGTIHKRYNQWVANLKGDIELQLFTL